MGTKANDTEPLSLSDIFEEEYRLLHGPLPPEFPERGAHDVRMRFITKQIHDLPDKRTALCLSGGGARSATFSLGVLRALARLRLLDKFDYLSTVSGGGYIGGWLSTWIHRHPRGLRGVMEDLSADAQTNSGREPEAVSWLRNYSKYLGLRLRFFSADSWTLLGTYLRNLILNWMMLLPLLVLPLLVPRWVIALAQLNTPEQPLPTVAVPVLLLSGLGLAVVALIYLHLCRPTLHPYRLGTWWHCLEQQRWFLTACLVPLVGAMLCLTTAWAWFRNAGGLIDQVSLYQSAAWGALTHTGTWLFATVALTRFKAISWWFVTEIVTVAATGALGGGLLWTVLAETPDQMAVAQYAEWFAFLAVPSMLSVFLLTLMLFTGMASRFAQEEDLEWWERTNSWVLITLVSWTVLSAVVIFGPGLLAWTPTFITLGAFSLVITLHGFGSNLASKPEASQSPLSTLSTWIEQLPAVAAPISMLLILMLLVLGTTWLLGIMAAGFLLHLSDPTGYNPDMVGRLMPPDPWGHNQVIHNTPLRLLIAFTLLMGFLGLIMARFININQFSLDATYRNRLIRTYLGASRPPHERQRFFNPFTGFDPRDNEAMCNLRFDDIRLARALYRNHLSESTRLTLERCRVSAMPRDLQDLNSLLERDVQSLIDRGALAQLSQELLLSPASIERLEAFRKGGPEDGLWLDSITWLRSIFLNRLDTVAPRPLHVINVALNLVSGNNLAWQDRKTHPFTVSPLHCGTGSLGYRPSQDYGGSVFLNRPLSLGTALTISGVPRVQSTGSDQFHLVNLVLAIFNLRSGWWLSNPGHAGATTYHHTSPAIAVGPVAAEAFGMMDSRYPYVYLSAGGHFENLGLYEMVHRRCHSILVVDASADPGFTFEDISNSIHKIRSDLGIEIELDLAKLHKQPGTGVSQWHHAIGKIRYDKADDMATVGTLLYLKPSLTSDEINNISEYAAQHRDFPHEVSADAYLNESQFEYYSQLGEHIAWEVLFPARHKSSHGFAAVCDELWSHWMSPTRNSSRSFQSRYVRPKQ